MIAINSERYQEKSSFEELELVKSKVYVRNTFSRQESFMQDGKRVTIVTYLNHYKRQYCNSLFIFLPLSLVVYM
jgi:hypothetical protein